jgi:hypothetical protein
MEAAVRKSTLADGGVTFGLAWLRGTGSVTGQVTYQLARNANHQWYHRNVASGFLFLDTGTVIGSSAAGSFRTHPDYTTVHVWHHCADSVADFGPVGGFMRTWIGSTTGDAHLDNTDVDTSYAGLQGSIEGETHRYFWIAGFRTAVEANACAVDDVFVRPRTVLVERAAEAILEGTTNFAENDTVTIGFDSADTTNPFRVYTFKASPSTADEIDIGVDLNTSLNNLRKAFDLSGTPGTEYGTGTTAHGQVRGTVTSGTLTIVASQLPGPRGEELYIAVARR